MHQFPSLQNIQDLELPLKEDVVYRAHDGTLASSWDQECAIVQKEEVRPSSHLEMILLISIYLKQVIIQALYWA